MIRGIISNKSDFYVDNNPHSGYEVTSINKQLTLIFLGVVVLVACVFLGFVGPGVLALGFCFVLSGLLVRRDRVFLGAGIVIINKSTVILGFDLAVAGFILTGFGIFLTYLQVKYPNLASNKQEVSTPESVDIGRVNIDKLNENPNSELSEFQNEYSNRDGRNLEDPYEERTFGVSFRNPEYLNDLIKSNEFYLEVATKDDLISKYRSYGAGGCPATCGLLAGDDKLLQDQFNMLNELELQPHCTLSKDYMDKVRQNFVLFSNAISNKIDIDGLSLNNGRCALRIVESDGFDASILNFYHKTVFTDKGKIYLITFKLFPMTRGIRVVDELWDTLGRKDSSCNEDCYHKESAYFSKVDDKDPIVQEVTRVYDQVVKTIEY